MLKKQEQITTSDVVEQARATQRKKAQTIWYCPSRWLLAHHDPQAKINTFSSHMCLADLNNDGESLLALIDFKKQELPMDDKKLIKSPFECRMRVYRGLQLIYNHFLDEMPSCLLATNMRADLSNQGTGLSAKAAGTSNSNCTYDEPQQNPMLTMAIMDDLYFYNRLRPAHRLSLVDEECILDSLVKSEIDAWQMVKQNRVDTETMRELLDGLSQELGNQELTSHSLNYLALTSIEARKQYLVGWKFKKLHEVQAEHIMSMDTICCGAARLKFSSNITRSGDFGQTRENGSFLNNSRWNRIIDLQKDGLIVGTEDRHLLIYELRALKSRLECHYRLPAVADHILVERRSPANFDVRNNFRELTYKILVSCRNCRIYLIDQLYLPNDKSAPCKLRQLVALKCNAVEMSWCGIEESSQEAGELPTNPSAPTWPLFIVACLDRRAYCFSSHTGQCKWIVEVELPITCLVCLPKLRIGLDESSLVGIGSQANRMDFYVALNGRIVDSIYLGMGDYPKAVTHGRFGREDNCLCIVTNLGHLLIFILKRTAKFAHGQCLSSAASYASDTLASCSQILQRSISTQEPEAKPGELLRLNKPVDLPSAFSFSKSNSATRTDQMVESMLQLDHNCDQVAAKSALESHIERTRLQIPTKGRDFVDQILDQSRHSLSTGRTFAHQMVKLREKVKSTLELEPGACPAGYEMDEANVARVMLTKVTGLGGTYRVCVAIRLNLEHFLVRSGDCTFDDTNSTAETCQLTLLIVPQTSSTSEPNVYRVKPHRMNMSVPRDVTSCSGVVAIFERDIQFKLFKSSSAPCLKAAEGASIEVQLMVLASRVINLRRTLSREPVLIKSINVPMS